MLGRSLPLGPLLYRADLDRGEHDAILLALHLKADLVLMDEREGAEEARRLCLTATGMLGVQAERRLNQATFILSVFWMYRLLMTALSLGGL